MNTVNFFKKSAIALVIAAVAFAGCDKDDPKPSYTVTFDSAGGSIVAAQTVEEGGTAARPEDPTRTGYVFDNWYLGSASAAYSFNTPVTADITLTAKWLEDDGAIEYWNITWNLNGGAWAEGSNPAEKVIRGKTLAEPNAPVKEGSTFEGWYKESAFANKITFPCTVTADMALYAKWTAEGGEEEPGTPAVYVCGDVENERGISVVKVWKDGEELYSMTDGTRDCYAREISVVGNDVYVAGEEENANGNSIAKVWKNGTELYALNPATESYSAKSIYVSGNDVYVAGSLSSGEDHYSKIWKNGQELYTLPGEASITKICVSGSDVYAVGTLYTWNDCDAAVWKNGSSYWISNHYSSGSFGDYLCISDGKIYVSEQPLSGFEPCVREIRGREDNISLYEYDNVVTRISEVSSFAVSDGDVYAAVEMKRTDTPITITSRTTFFKNETELYHISGTQYMYLFGEDIYSTGNDGKVWKNGTELYTLDEDGVCTSIVVVNE